MAASLHAVGRATSAFNAMGPTTGGNEIVQVVHYSLTADASNDDVFQMIKIPIGAIITDGWIALDSGAGSPFTFSVGDGASVGRYITAGSVSVSATLHHFASQANITPGLGHKYTANDTIDVKITSVTATVALDFTLCVKYILDGQTGGTVSS